MPFRVENPVSISCALRSDRTNSPADTSNMRDSATCATTST
jgi:hypothetical protein